MNVPIILGTLAFFGLAHSLTAGPGLKAWAQRVMSERAYHGLYRLLYNAFSVVTFAPVLLALALLPDRRLYSVPLPWVVPLVALQVGSMAGLLGSLLVTDLLDFVGLRQLAALLKGDPLPLPAVPFNPRGVYALVRHPVYLFTLIFLWAAPVMTLDVLLFNLGTTAYLLVGTFPEERKLVALYGDLYRAYQGRVPRLLPWPRPRPQAQGGLSGN